MAHDESMREREPTAEELARIRSARAELRRTILSRTLLPGALTFAFVAVTLGFFGSVLASGAVLLISRVMCRRLLKVSLGLGRDAARGYLVAKRAGEIGWGSEGPAIAKAGGQLLVSPWFTEHRPTPAMWHQFDQLAPGCYEFDLLPESGLVLAALSLAEKAAEPGGPSANGAPSEHLPANRALQTALRLRPSDILANRHGRASAAQCRRLVLGHGLFLWGLAMAVPATLFGLAETVAKPSVEHVLCALGGGLTLFVVVHVLRHVIRDVKAGDVDIVVGYVRFREEEDGNFTGIIVRDRASPTGVSRPRGRWDVRRPAGGAPTFDISRARAKALQPTLRYQFYVFPRSRYLAGAEILGDG